MELDCRGKLIAVATPLFAATGELVDHAPERDEELIRHIMDIFTRGILKQA